MSVADDLNRNIQRHYTVTDLGAQILAALEKAGKDVTRLRPEDLAPIDEFHVRGRVATLELARAAKINSSKVVLDVGSGLGGPARCLASEFGCKVTGIDLTDEYCRVAEMLSARVGLEGLVNFRQGDALNMPFPDASFDVVWTEHVAMNIPDKLRLYREMRRVLKPGGALAIYDILAGAAGPVHFPVPWARTSETSALVSPDELRLLLEKAGFKVEDWQDTTQTAKAWFVALAEKIRKEGLPPLGWGLLMGNDFQEMAQNQRRNLEEGRVALIQVIARNQAT